MTPTKPAGHEDVPEDVLEVGRKTFLQIPGSLSQAVDAAINAAVLADRSRRAGAVRVTNNLIRKGVIERPADSGELIRLTDLGRASLAKEGKSDD